MHLKLRWHLPIVLMSCFVTTGLAEAAAPTPITAESIARLPAIQSVSMSSDGRNLVALVASPTDPAATALATWDMDTIDSGPTSITPSGDRMKFIAANALKGNHILVIGRQEWTGQLGGCGEGSVSGATKTFVTKAYLTDTSHTKFGEAFASNTRRVGVSEQMQRCLEIAGSASLVHQLPLDPDRVVISQVNEMTLASNYYLYNLKTGQTELLDRGGTRTSPGLLHPRTGEILTRSQIESIGADEYEQRILVRGTDTGAFDLHPALTTRLTDRYTMEVVGIDDATGKFYILTDRFSPHIQARMYDPVKREFDPEALVAHPEFDIASLVLGAQPSNFNQVLGFVVDAADRETVYVDPTLKSIADGLKQAYPGQTVRINSYTDDLSKLLFTTSSARHSPAYHVLVDRERVVSLGAERPWIDPASIGEQRWISYTARDGRQIPAILDLPAGWSAGDGTLPAVIHPHGGPWARDHGGWDASGWVPFLTSRGYAVLRPQYRGSVGLGRDLWIAGDAQWGLAMQDDKDDGAAWLVAEGIADKERLAIFGYSYGGFAAAAAVVRESSPYQCAISGAPVTDLARLGTSWSQNRLQRILQGRTVKGMDPMRNAGAASIPVLLFVGDRDVRTPSFHAQGFFNAVTSHVDARFELIPDMPHSMPWYPAHQLVALGAMESFLSNECGLTTADRTS